MTNQTGNQHIWNIMARAATELTKNPKPKEPEEVEIMDPVNFNYYCLGCKQSLINDPIGGWYVGDEVWNCSENTHGHHMPVRA